MCVLFLILSLIFVSFPSWAASLPCDYSTEDISNVLFPFSCEVKSKSLNVRENPSVKSNILKTLKEGDSVILREKIGEWMKIDYTNVDVKHPRVINLDHPHVAYEGWVKWNYLHHVIPENRLIAEKCTDLDGVTVCVKGEMEVSEFGRNNIFWFHGWIRTNLKNYEGEKVPIVLYKCGSIMDIKTSFNNIRTTLKKGEGVFKNNSSFFSAVRLDQNNKMETLSSKVHISTQQKILDFNVHAPECSVEKVFFEECDFRKYLFDEHVSWQADDALAVVIDNAIEIEKSKDGILSMLSCGIFLRNSK